MTEPEKITVSRDALRADLAEMELRLKSYILLELDKKAPTTQLDRLSNDFYALKQHALVNTGPIAASVRLLEEGSFSKAQRLAILEMIDLSNQKHSKEAWSWRDRILTLVGTIIAAIALTFTIIFTLHSVRSIEISPTTNTTTTSISQGGH